MFRSLPLRRLESQGLLTGEWREENNRRKRFYRLSREGKVMLDAVRMYLAEKDHVHSGYAFVGGIPGNVLLAFSIDGR